MRIMATSAPSTCGSVSTVGFSDDDSVGNVAAPMSAFSPNQRITKNNPTAASSIKRVAACQPQRMRSCN